MEECVLRVASAYAGREEDLARLVSSLRAAGARSALPERGDEKKEQEEEETVRAAVEAAARDVAEATREAARAGHRAEETERVHSLVQRFLKLQERGRGEGGGGGEEEEEKEKEALMRDVEQEATRLQHVKAFRMIREKLASEKSGKQANTAANSDTAASGQENFLGVRVADALEKLRLRLEADTELNGVLCQDLMVVDSVAECVSLVSGDVFKNDRERMQVIEGMFLLLVSRFNREMEIPLYAALHYNCLTLLQSLAKQQIDLSSMLGFEAERVLAASVKRASSEIEGHVSEALAETNKEGLDRVIDRCGRRCSHGLGLVRRAWSGALKDPILRECVKQVAGVALEGLSLIALGVARAEERDRVGAALLMAGSRIAESAHAEQGELQRRQALGVAWSRLRKTAELLQGAMPKVQSLTSCFSEEETRKLVSACVVEGSEKKKILAAIATK